MYNTDTWRVVYLIIFARIVSNRSNVIHQFSFRNTIFRSLVDSWHRRQALIYLLYYINGLQVWRHTLRLLFQIDFSNRYPSKYKNITFLYTFWKHNYSDSNLYIHKINIQILTLDLLSLPISQLLSYKFTIPKGFIVWWCKYFVNCEKCPEYWQC